MNTTSFDWGLAAVLFALMTCAISLYGALLWYVLGTSQ